MVAVASGFPVVVVGAGQAGLAVSYELTVRGIEHVVLERARVGQRWRGLWDSFWLVTPNWTMSLPGAPSTGDDPEGFVPRDEVAGHRATLAGDLADSVAFGDARHADLRKLLGEQLPPRGIAAPELPDPPPFHADPPLELDLNGFGVAILASGFRPDYARWVRFPAFDAMGFPRTDNGASTEVPGLSFCGVHFLRTRKSSVLFGVGEDAAIVAQAIATHQPPHNPPSA
jgi:hypothetical protein